MNGPAIKVQNIAKKFGEVHAVRRVSFDLRQGEIFSLLARLFNSPKSVRTILNG